MGRKSLRNTSTFLGNGSAVPYGTGTVKHMMNGNVVFQR